MSYAHSRDSNVDDEQLNIFRQQLAAEVRAQTGQEFAIFQDRTDIAWGQNWQQRINETLDSVSLLLVIITPGFFQSTASRAEVSRFLDRERELGRSDLILPVYYASAREMDDPTLREGDEVARALATRQFVDWRQLRFEPPNSPAARKAVRQLASRMRELWQPDPIHAPSSEAGKGIGAGAGFSDDLDLRVMVSADASADTGIARRLLSGESISVVTWDEDSTLDLESALNGVNALVALVDRRAPSTGVLLEIGAALGRGMPVVLLLSSAHLSTTLPSRLRELPTVVLAGAEEAVSRRLTDTVRSAVEAVPASRLPTQARASRSYVRQVEAREWADEAERRVAAALANLGARVVGQVPANDRRQVDLAAWIPALPIPHLNPILVEVAGKRPNVQMRTDHLLRFLRDRDVQIGMLILAEEENPSWVIREGRAIVILSLQGLYDLTPDSLVQLIMDGRNRLAHVAL